MKLSKTMLATGLTTLFLMTFGTGCSVLPKPQVVQSVSPTLPPRELMADCPHAAVPTARSNAGLALYAQAERQALTNCNLDKKALRTWADSISTAVQPK